MPEPLNLTRFSKGGGCGCKIAPAVLKQILASPSGAASFPQLLVGNESADDAAVYQLDNGTALVSTTDFFVPIVDDAFDFGRIAAANALSDVYAMGATPLLALAILGWPLEKLPAEEAKKVLDGARSVCAEAGIPLAGGHSIETGEPVFGLAVTGRVAPGHLKRNNTAREGDRLFLTKPLGVGVLSTALKRGLLHDEHYPTLLRQLTTLNRVGEALGAVNSVHALTDVTGFGLLGHLVEMAEGSGLSVELNYSALPRVEGLATYLQQRTLPDATFRNWNAYNQDVAFAPGVDVMEAFNLLPDPQTNGGLLIAATDAGVLQAAFEAHGLSAFLTPIGVFKSGGEKRITVLP